MRMTLGKLRLTLAEAIAVGNKDRDEMISIYSDVFKEKHGIRPRWMYDDLAQMPMEELEDELNRLYDEPSSIDWDDIIPYNSEANVTPEEMVDVHPMENEPSRSGMHRR